MSTSVQINGNCFTLTVPMKYEELKEVAQREQIDINGITWSIITRRFHQPQSRILSSVCCSTFHKEEWHAKGTVKLHLFDKNGKAIDTTSLEVEFGNDKSVLYPILLKETHTNRYPKFEDVVVKYEVEIESCVNTVTTLPNPFAEKIEHLTDVMLVVEDTSFYVSKAVLGSFSPVFRAMFYAGFQETAGDRVEIEEVPLEPFLRFLQLLYHQEVEISDRNVEGLLMIADRYDVPFVTKKCEKFLIKCFNCFNNEKQLKLAELYRLEDLKSRLYPSD